MSAELHGNRERALSFGADPQRYDRFRPRYPQQLVDDLLDGHRPRVLDVGCGTGIAAEAFLAAGCDVLGVEPDPRMAAVARSKGISVEVATFEEWPAAGRLFDLVTCGQAWHWVDPAAGPAKAASVLPPGGRLAVFWNLGRHDAVTQRLLDEAYARHTPDKHNSSLTGHLGVAGGEPHATAILAGGYFAAPRVQTYEWSAQYTTREWIDQLPTHSDHRLLPPDVLAALLADIAVAIDSVGGRLTLSYETLLVTATRAGA